MCFWFVELQRKSRRIILCAKSILFGHKACRSKSDDWRRLGDTSCDESQLAQEDDYRVCRDGSWMSKRCIGRVRDRHRRRRPSGAS